MKKAILLAVVLVGCGGSDATIDGGPDSGVNPGTDSGGVVDSGGGVDAGDMDSGGGMDSGGMDSGGGGIGSISCLVLWLDAAKGVTQMNNAVSAWADQSGKNNNATQNMGVRQPTLVMNGANNLPAIRFNQGDMGTGNMLVIPDSMTMQWGTGDFALWMVARYNNIPNSGFSTGSGLLWNKQPPQGVNSAGLYFVGNYASGGPNYTAGLGVAIDQSSANTITQAGAYNDNTARAFSYRRAGTSLDLRVNGMTVALKQQTGMVNISAPNTPVRIGADGDASQRRLNGEISEIIGCQGQISNQDLQTIDAYLKNKYAL